MQSAILVKDGSNVLAKMVYAGDLSFVDVEVTRLRAKYPTYTVTKFDSDQDSNFVNAVYNNPGNIDIR